MKRRVISLWLPRLPTDRVQRCERNGALWANRDRKSQETRSPLIVITETGGQPLVTGLNREAKLTGLTMGMTLSDARAVFPAVAVASADPTADAALLDRLVAWC